MHLEVCKCTSVLTRPSNARKVNPPLCVATRCTYRSVCRSACKQVQPLALLPSLLSHADICLRLHTLAITFKHTCALSHLEMHANVRGYRFPGLCHQGGPLPLPMLGNGGPMPKRGRVGKGPGVVSTGFRGPQQPQRDAVSSVSMKPSCECLGCSCCGCCCQTSWILLLLLLLLRGLLEVEGAAS